MPLKLGRPLKLYVLATDTTIGSMLAQKNDEGKEHAVYYLSRMLNETKKRYTAIEKMGLSLYFACTKLRQFM